MRNGHLCDCKSAGDLKLDRRKGDGDEANRETVHDEVFSEAEKCEKISFI